jgi:hypothetical protein
MTGAAKYLDIVSYEVYKLSDSGYCYISHRDEDDRLYEMVYAPFKLSDISRSHSKTYNPYQLLHRVSRTRRITAQRQLQLSLASALRWGRHIR